MNTWQRGTLDHPPHHMPPPSFLLRKRMVIAAQCKTTAAWMNTQSTTHIPSHSSKPSQKIYEATTSTPKLIFAGVTIMYESSRAMNGSHLQNGGRSIWAPCYVLRPHKLPVNVSNYDEHHIPHTTKRVQPQTHVHLYRWHPYCHTWWSPSPLLNCTWSTRHPNVQEPFPEAGKVLLQT